MSPRSAKQRKHAALSLTKFEQMTKQLKKKKDGKISNISQSSKLQEVVYNYKRSTFREWYVKNE